LLRSDLTLPLEPGTKTGKTYTQMSEGVFLPLWHCPFLHCDACWQSADKCVPHEQDWWMHIWHGSDHKAMLLQQLAEAHMTGTFLEAQEET
jgi:hypothetical protein